MGTIPPKVGRVNCHHLLMGPSTLLCLGSPRTPRRGGGRSPKRVTLAVPHQIPCLPRGVPPSSLPKRGKRHESSNRSRPAHPELIDSQNPVPGPMSAAGRGSLPSSTRSSTWTRRSFVARWVRWLSVVPLQLRTLLHARVIEAELAEELTFHLERKAEQYIARGLTLDEARRRARFDLGGIESSKERCRDARCGRGAGGRSSGTAYA